MQKPDQRQHIDSVIALVNEGDTLLARDAKEDFIAQSWARCMKQYQLDPTRPREARILPAGQVREHREAVEKFLHVARFGIEQLYQQVAGMGYVLLLTDQYGITVDYIGDRNKEKELRQAGLYLGADWNEAHAGTCGVGTAIAEGRAFTCHQTDHFDATHIQLTCTTSPLFDPYGELLGILDISALHSPEPKSSQYMALELVKIYAQRIENANFLDCFRHQWILRLSRSPEFVEVDPQYLLAVDSSGLIQGFNRSLQALLMGNEQPFKRKRRSLIGCSIEEFFQCQVDDLPRLATADAPRSRTLLTQGTQQLLYSSVIPPKVRRGTTASSSYSSPRSELQKLSGGDPQMKRNIQQATRLANARINILLSGATGTGKEYFAKALHAVSARADKPFIAINCAALPEALIESELFGYEAGAFTGAHSKGKKGLILAADGGTLFLDEIGDMPLALQARLLRVLAQQEVLPIGANQPIQVDLHIISATHCDLDAMVGRNAFREDLYHRLNGFQLALPSLQQRTDKAFLIEKILRQESSGRTVTLSAEVQRLFEQCAWPGNIRELRNVLQFAVAVCDGEVIGLDDLPDHFLNSKSVTHTHEPALACEQKLAPAGQQLLSLLTARQWNISAVARELGVARITVYRQMAKHDIVPPNKQSNR